MRASRAVAGIAVGWVALVAVVATGCAGAAPAPPAAPRVADPGSPAGDGASPGPFPSPDEIEALTRSAPRGGGLVANVHDVKAWTLEGPFPQTVDAAVYRDSSPWGELLARAAERRAGLVVPTEAMHCVAREVGRFRLVFEAEPGQNLSRFIRARCGASVVSVSQGYLYGAVAADASDEAAFANWRPAIEDMISQHLVGGPLTAGIWFGRHGGRAVAVVVAGERVLRVEPLPMVLRPGEKLVIRGEVLRSSMGVEALINRGSYGVAACTPQPGVTLPRFQFVCEAEPGDESAWVTVNHTAPDRLLSEAGLDLLVWPGGQAGSVYRQRTYTPPHPMKDLESLDGDLLALVNRVRREAGARPLSLERAQSETARQLAPYFFASMLGKGPASDADLVLLGMLAGWNVDGIIQDAGFTASWAPQSTDLSQLLSAALESPVGRRTLLSPEVERLAVGAVVGDADGGSSLGAVYTTYTLFSEERHAARADRVLERLRRERARRGADAPRALDELEPLAVRLASAVQAGGDPEDALSELVQAGAQILGRPVNGWMAEVSELDRLEFPDEFLTRPELGVAVGVSYRKPEGEPWGRWVVMIVAASARQHSL